MLRIAPMQIEHALRREIDKMGKNFAGAKNNDEIRRKVFDERRGRIIIDIFNAQRFNEARDWGRFHHPKDLAMCLAAEAGELLEPFLWKATEDALDGQAIREELADVVICAVNLASRLDIDLAAAVDAKIALNGERYPVERAKGTRAASVGSRCSNACTCSRRLLIPCRWRSTPSAIKSDIERVRPTDW